MRGIATSHLHHRWSPTKGTNRNWLPHPRRLGGPTSGRSCYDTTAISGCAELLHYPCIPGVPKKGVKYGIGYLTPAFSVGAQVRGNATSLQHHRWSRANLKIGIGYLTPVFSRGPGNGGIAITPLNSPGSATRRHNRSWLPHPCLLGRPQAGGIATSIVHHRWSPTKGTHQNWLPHPRRLVGAQVGGIAMSTMHSWGCPTRGTNSELAASTVPSRGPKSGRNCYATPTFSGAPQQGGPNGNSLAHLCLLGGPQVGGIATSPLHSRGSPTRRTNSELATSPVPS